MLIIRRKDITKNKHNTLIYHTRRINAVLHSKILPQLVGSLLFYYIFAFLSASSILDRHRFLFYPHFPTIHMWDNVVSYNCIVYRERPTLSFFAAILFLRKCQLCFLFSILGMRSRISFQLLLHLFTIININGLSSPIIPFTNYMFSIELLPNMADLWWNIDSNTNEITFELHMNTTGWIALGISPSTISPLLLASHLV